MKTLGMLIVCIVLAYMSTGGALIALCLMVLYVLGILCNLSSYPAAEPDRTPVNMVIIDKYLKVDARTVARQRRHYENALKDFNDGTIVTSDYTRLE